MTAPTGSPMSSPTSPDLSTARRGWVAPFQPRLDWQMWFAALGNYRENPWLIRLMQRLLEGSPPVLELHRTKSVSVANRRSCFRAVVYDYRFTTFDERRRTGNWWKRVYKGTYFPPGQSL